MRNFKDLLNVNRYVRSDGDRPAYPSLEELILTYECLRRQAEGEAGSSIDAFGQLDRQEKAATAYRWMRRAQAFLGLPDEVSAQHKPILLRLERFLEAFQDLVDAADLEHHVERVRLRLSATHILLFRLVPGMLRAFRALPAARDRRLDLDLIQDEPEPLVQRGRHGGADLVLTSCPGDLDLAAEAEPECHADVWLPRCLLFHRNHPFAATVPTWGELFAADPPSAWRRLGGEVLIRLADVASEPGFPWERVPRPRRVVQVSTYAEAHAHVLSDVGVAFSHHALLGEEEARSLIAADVSGVLGRTRLAAWVPRGVLGRLGEAERPLLRELFGVVRARLLDLTDDHAGSPTLRRTLPHYRCLWTVTRRRGRLAWSVSDVDLRVTPTGYVCGTERCVFPPAIYALDGRCHDAHLILIARTGDLARPADAEQEGMDHYALDLHLPNCLDECPPLVGTWVGKDQRKRRAQGAAVLLPALVDGKPATGLAARRLNELVRQARPDYYGAARGCIRREEDAGPV